MSRATLVRKTPCVFLAFWALFSKAGKSIILSTNALHFEGRHIQSFWLQIAYLTEIELYFVTLLTKHYQNSKKIQTVLISSILYSLEKINFET